MTAHARRAQPGVTMVGEGPTCGRRNGSTVFLTGAEEPSMPAGKTRRKSKRGHSRRTRLFRHRIITDAAGCGSLDGPWETQFHPLWECPRRWELGLRLYGTASAHATARLGRNACHFLRTSLALLTDYCNTIQQREKQFAIMMNVGCASRGPTIHVVCVPSVRGANSTVSSRRMCMRWRLVFRSCLLSPPPSVCCCCDRAVCVCVCLLPWIGVCVVRGVRRTVHAWLLSSPHVVCPLCVCVCRTSRLPCCSPCPSLCRSAP
ncbi:hypothetical protein MOQ_002216, partial [Trypanosoma cruzi marinkellei]